MDGTLTISGGTLLAGGNQGMTQIDKEASNSQKYISSKNSYTANQVVYILNGDTTIREITIPKNIQYLYYTSSDVGDSYTFSTTEGEDSNISDSNTSFLLNINVLYLFGFILFI